jgi:hypothetical protein
MEDTYLQYVTQVGESRVFAHADLSPDGRHVAYSWLDGEKGVAPVRRHCHRRSDAARARVGCQRALGAAASGTPGVEVTSLPV